ncbi:MAG: 2-hydroxychromene-2-carboxylate isomerase [Betaproteobacteria bacterium]|nr:MAG: 2-hydroxychromene-2-carboxylate isomerase [Betaproteobacteria bacterium]
MTKLIDYYFATISPFMYLGHDRFIAIARKHGATITVKPINLGEVFPVSGGLPLSKRAPQRQAYRLLELKRWSEYLNMPLNCQPRFLPVNGDLAAGWILAAHEQGPAQALALTGAIGRAIWAQQLDVSSESTLVGIAQELDLDAAVLGRRAATTEIAERYKALTQEAIERKVFGSPTYIYRDELFWGQDRLDFLDRALAK